MAKRKTVSGGPSTGLIVTLIFFILTTFIAGTLAYFGFAEQEGERKKAADAKKAEDNQKVATEREEATGLVYKMGLGIANEKESAAFSAYLNGPREAEIKAEIARLVAGVASLEKFTWMLEKDKAEPLKGRNILGIVEDFKRLKKEAEDAKGAAIKDKVKSEEDFKTKSAQFTTQITNLESAKSKVENDLKEAEKKKKSEFEDLLANNNKKDQELAARIAEIAQLKEDSKREIKKKDDKLIDLEGKVKNFESKIASGPDLLVRDTKKADVERRDGGFIYLNRGSNDLLRVQTTFSILPSDAVWRTSDEKERLIKGEVEVIEILGPNSARAKIISGSERQPIRDPIRAKDLLFNVVWTPGMPEHIAFAGIIDLNGDGIDDNKAFFQLLEKQGVVIDQYLDLEDRTFKGKGMNISTKFLVLGPEVVLDADLGDKKAQGDPRVAAKQDILLKMSQLKGEAAKLGVQIIDYRKFMISIGLRPPERPKVVDYGSIQYQKKEDREIPSDAPKN